MTTTNGRGQGFRFRLRTGSGGTRRSWRPAVQPGDRDAPASTRHPVASRARPRPIPHRRVTGRSWASIAAVSCLAGAVIAMGVVLVTRPDRVIVRRAKTELSQAATSVVFRPVTPSPPSGWPARSLRRSPGSTSRARGLATPASAVLINGDGTLLTSADLVDGNRKIVVTFDDGRARSARPRRGRRADRPGGGERPDRATQRRPPRRPPPEPRRADGHGRRSRARRRAWAP